MTADERAALFDAWAQRLQARLDELLSAQAAATAGTRVDGTHRPANRGERAAVSSQGYLAGALGARIAEVQAALAATRCLPPDPRGHVGAGAVFAVQDEAGVVTRYAVLPGAQGDALPAGLTAVSPRAPLVRALRGREVGDVVEFRRGASDAELELVELS